MSIQNVVGLVVRLAQEKDLLEVFALEQRAWLNTGVPQYTFAHFYTWLEINPECFLVAESNGRIVGYSYQQRINFSFADICKFTSHEQSTDGGYTKKTHVGDGNSFYGVSVVSIRAGAGIMLDRAMYDLGRKLGLQYYIGFPRLAGFDGYMRGLGGGKLTLVDEKLEADIALWYAIKCVEAINGKIWDVCPRPCVLSLSPPRRLDRVLNWHLKNKEFGLVGVVSDYMPDRQSRNYAAFNVYQFPLL